MVRNHHPLKIATAGIVGSSSITSITPNTTLPYLSLAIVRQAAKAEILDKALALLVFYKAFSLQGAKQSYVPTICNT